MTDSAKTENYKRVILLLLSLLIANPVILYLLTQNVVLTLGIPIIVILIVLGTYAVAKHRLITVYVINFLALASIFLHAEVLFENAFSDYIIEDLYTIEDGYYFNKKRLDKHFIDKEYEVDYLTNNQGYRIGYGQHVEDQVEKVDWLFIGDSYTQGAQVEFEELYTTQLYRFFPDKIILNAGISGYGIVEEYYYYKNQGYLLGADKVFLQLCNFNDFMNVREKSGSVTDYLAHYSDFLRFLLQDIKYTNPAELPLGRWTEPFYPDEESNKDYNIFYTEASDVKKQDLEAFKRYLGLFKKEVERHGAELIVVLIPTKEQINFTYLEEVVESFQLDVAKLDMDYPNRIVHSMADSLNVELIDLLEHFQQAPQEVFFNYDEHLNGYGHSFMAEIIASTLIADHYSSVRILGGEIAGERYPIVGPDGSLISYQSMAGGNMEIFLADSTFEAVQRVTVNDVDESHPMLSPDRERLVFTEGDQEALQTNVGMMYIDGSGRTSLTPEEHIYGAIPTFSPDGNVVTYAEWMYDEEQDKYTNSQIAKLDITTGEKEYVTSPEVESWRPVFSPSGNKLAYISKRDGQFDVFVRDLESGDEINVTDTPYDEWDPQFSHDGRYLVYSSQIDDNWDLVVYDFDMAESVRITHTKGDEWDPSFSAYDDRILFAGKFGFLKTIYEMPFAAR